ncbi:hypothetical protein [Burkholderia stagnalis]|uniref:non-homologous end-joining DNA ligase LigD n=1 Tax=Burkholderia stagnalis TaxID=1503054 RepID=UPI00075309BC|nr:hypothetical protein [Burkholderia stagnalis]KVX55398.1 hypothetical protein WT33_26795 [Burkholderia stagnalis]
MMINSLQALLGAVQMGAVEFHIWNATRKNLDCPDWLILDQDSDRASPWKRMVETMQLTLVVPDRLTAVSGPSRDAHGIDRVEIHRQIDHELMWLRVMPENGLGKTWTISEVRGCATAAQGHLRPLWDHYGGFSYLRHPDGFGVFARRVGEHDASTVMFTFKTGFEV